MKIKLFLLVASVLMVTTNVSAATVTFNGTLSVIDIDTGTGIYSGAAVGDSFSGTYTYGNSASDADIIPFPYGTDYNFVGTSYDGFLSDGTTVIGDSDSVDIYIGNNEPLDAKMAALISDLLGSNISEGTMVDVWAADSNSASAYYDNFNQLRDGVSFVIGLVSFDTGLYSDSSFQVMPPAIADVDIALFFIEEADASGNIIFYASGVLGAVSAVPVPAAVWLFGSGLIGLIGVARRKVRP